MVRTLFPVRPEGQVVVTGSLAFDQIMIFPGHFKDHILPDKLHLINLSFLVSELRRHRGGCAGNIAYSLALLGERPRIVAVAGKDFGEYRQWLIEHGVDVAAIRIVADELTASCFITTDQANNQITGFFVGAMPHARELGLAAESGPSAALAVVAPDDPAAMLRHCEEARRAGLPFVFDPSFQVIAMPGDDLAAAARGAKVMMCNDYEAAVFSEKTGRGEGELLDLVEVLVVTLGPKGCRIRCRSGEEILVDAAPVDRVIDPTGAGDAFRAGFAAGVMRGHDLEVCARMGSVAAAYAIEHHGTQSHAFTPAEFAARYAVTFGPLPSEGPQPAEAPRS